MPRASVGNSLGGRDVPDMLSKLSVESSRLVQLCSLNGEVGVR